MASVQLGNVSHIVVKKDPNTGAKVVTHSAHIRKSTTSVHNLPPGLFAAMRDTINIWGNESDQPPAWLESDDPALEAALREHFGCGPRPDDWVHDIGDPAEAQAPETGEVA